MRLFAALGLLALSAFAGYAKSFSLSARVSALSAFAEEVPQLLLRMEYESLPLNSLAVAMGGRETLLAAFWAGFGEGLLEKDAEASWRSALGKSAPYGLTPGDRALLQGLGGTLAAPDGAGRKQASACILQELTRQRDILREDMARKGSLYGTLGLLLGLAAAILII